MPETTRPQDVPDDLLIAALSAWTGKPLHSLHDLIEVDIDDHDAMERTLRAVIPEIQRRERERIAAEHRATAQAIEDTRGEVDDPLAEEIWQTCERDPEVPAVREDPRTVAIVAYRHLADRLAAGET
jgi:hypothetical protein